MKWIAAVLILTVWIHHAAGYDRKRVLHRYRPIIHAGYALLTLGTVMWL